MSSLRAAITAVSGWVPEDILDNHQLEQMVETNDEWIQTRTGIKERRILKKEGAGTSYMATKAINSLLEKRGITANDIDVIICATITPDLLFPSTANLICEQIGAKNALSFDLAAACSGFIYALETGSNFIKSGQYKKVVVVGADKMSAIIDYTDRSTCILFGDGAGAVLLEPDEEGYGVYDSILKTDGSGKDLLRAKGHGSADPLTPENIIKGEHFFYQEGKAVFKFAVTRMADVSAEIMKRNNLTGDDIAYLVPHQANKRIIEATAKRMGVGMDKVTLNIQKFGNTTGATIPLCLWEFEKDFKKGDNIVLAAFGGGFTWGSVYLKWAYNS
ncbi:beta-ketoacyl-ACP synthase III [Chondrinema litorale]|uniref:beta-ketoacyl-ACP synthase III n=1 Tax=Chondrinema litorale TaxID=2994555 RepID=UPI002543258C|nr:beta-ketoacyl-ACP synthase III [Chondrinema litorale]UZR93573.1 ketoacyl-ACP synthase III [Chondrinema litorale]